MKLKYIGALLISFLLLAACSEKQELQPDNETEEYTYSFTAILDGAKTRLGYEEDEKTHNLKMVWEEGDVIRLYPDKEKMKDDDSLYYTFTANTGVGTSHTVFVHQGYIKGWENWSGKAIYVFPDEDNLNVPYDDEGFFAKSQVQIANDNTEHLKYAEHKLGDDGKKQYTEYWSNIINGENLKHDTKLHFRHTTTQVYKIMLHGFIYDILGGSLLKVSGASWPDEEISIQLGKPEDKEPFLEVGEYYQSGWKEDALLTAYIIRQVPTGGEDAAIKKNEKLKIELLAYDPNDGKVMPLNPEDKEEHRHKTEDMVGGESRYFTNIPWAEEYIWEVTATADRVYKAGDYVVADLSKSKIVRYSQTIINGYYDSQYYIETVERDESLPRVAVDLGLTTKWATFNIGASKVTDKGFYFVPGHPTPCDNPPTSQHTLPTQVNWTAGDPEYDAATANWGADWRMATFQEGIDLFQYTEVLDGNDDKYPVSPQSSIPFWDTKWSSEKYKQLVGCVVRQIDGVSVTRVQSVLEPKKSIYFPATGKYEVSQNSPHRLNKPNNTYPLLAPYIHKELVETYKSLYYNINRSHMQDVSQQNEKMNKISFSVRAVRNRPAASASSDSPSVAK